MAITTISDLFNGIATTNKVDHEYIINLSILSLVEAKEVFDQGHILSVVYFFHDTLGELTGDGFQVSNQAMSWGEALSLLSYCDNYEIYCQKVSPSKTDSYH